MIFLTLFCAFVSVQGEIHNLRYIYTALSKLISQSGVYQFTAVGILDDRQIDFYNSEDKVKKPMQKWMEEHNKTDYSMNSTQSRRRMEQWFDFSIKILIEHMRQNKPDPDVHILQWMHGCQVEKTTDGKLKFLKGFDQYGYDGEDFLSFNIQRTEWVVHANAAESTKKKWDDEPVLSQYTKEYLETECVHWLEKLVKLQTFSPPEVHLFSKNSTSPDNCTLVCLATGFYPKNVSVNILKDGVPLAESDGVASSGVRPNGERKETFQLRKWLEIKASDTSNYSCRIHHRTLRSPIEESWAPPELHLFSKKSTSPDNCTLVCLATGFYPKDVAVNILKDGVPLAESDGVASSGVRPNGDRKEKFQLRKWLEIKASDTSKYSCRIHHRTLSSPIEESWDGKFHNCDGDNTGAIVGGVVGVVLLIVLVTVLVVLYVLRKKKIEKEKAAQAPVNGLIQLLTGNGLACESTILSPEVNPETKRSNNYVESGDSVLLGCGSICSGGPKEEVYEPLMVNEEGEQQPQLEAAEVV